MSSTDFLPTREGDLVPWTENFIAVANVNLTVIGLAAGDITTLTTKKSTYSTNLNTAIAKQIESKSATDNKNVARDALKSDIRGLAKQIQAHPGVPDNIKVQLGLKAGSPTPSPSFPIIPNDLSANIGSVGIISLSWNRSGKSQGTIFIIESSTAPDKMFTMIDSTTKTTLDTNFRNPTGPTFFRVRAKKNDQTSDPSNVVVV